MIGSESVRHAARQGDSARLAYRVRSASAAASSSAMRATSRSSSFL